MAACTSTRCAASTDSTHGASASCARICSAALTGSPRHACCTSWRRADRPRRALRARRAAHDGRQSLLSLTAKGREAFSVLDSRSRDAMAAMLKPLGEQDTKRLVEAMRTVQGLLSDEKTHSAVQLREHRPGDLGWVVHRHGALYAEEYGWDERFEALVAEIVARFVRHFDPALE